MTTGAVNRELKALTCASLGWVYRRTGSVADCTPAKRRAARDVAVGSTRGAPTPRGTRTTYPEHRMRLSASVPPWSTHQRDVPSGEQQTSSCRHRGRHTTTTESPHRASVQQARTCSRGCRLAQTWVLANQERTRHGDLSAGSANEHPWAAASRWRRTSVRKIAGSSLHTLHVGRKVTRNPSPNRGFMYLHSVARPTQGHPQPQVRTCPCRGSCATCGLLARGYLAAALQSCASGSFTPFEC